MARLDTAHQTWNETWLTEKGRKDWSTPDAEVLAVGTSVLSAGGSRALDVGAGLGRHALALGRLGFTVEAIDASESGIAQIRSAAAIEELPVHARVGRMDELPFGDDSFDLVLSFNVIYHGDRSIAQSAIYEMRRVLRPGGTLMVTMLSKRNAHFGVGEEIAPGTFVVEGAKDDKIHPHFYCNAAELVEMLSGLEPLSIVDREQKPTHWHWHAVAVKA
jgi:SAM-dependent methyltransferase